MKPQTAAHTPTPWKLKQLAVAKGGYPDMWTIVSNVKNKALPFARGDLGYTVAEVDGTANAAFIVRAVNAHEELVNLAKELFRRMSINQDGEDWYKGVKQAIAKAEGR